MKINVDVLKAILSGEFNKPLWEMPKTLYDLPKRTTLGNMYYISIVMLIDGKY